MEDYRQAVQKYFTSEEWKKMNRMQQTQYVEYYYVYIQCIELDIDVVKPDFMSIKTEIYPCDTCTATFNTKHELNLHNKYCLKRLDDWSESTKNLSFKSLQKKQKLTKKAAGQSKKAKIRQAVALEVSNDMFKILPPAMNSFQHKCNMCDISFRKNFEAYKKHLRIVHTVGKGLFQCTYCPLQTSNILRHIEIVHFHIKRFQCTLCDRKVTDVRNMKTHVLHHQTDQLVKCPHCNYRAFRLHKHLKESHSDKLS